MKLIKTENYELKIADEALLVRPIRKLWDQDRTKNKETFYKQMSVLFYVYDPSSNYAYISDENERMKEVLAQEGIKEFHNTADFKDAVAAYKKLVKTPSTELLADVRLTVDKMRQALVSIDFNDLDEKDKVNAIKTVTTVVGQMPTLIKNLSEAEKAVTKELEEQGNTRGSQELTIGDMGL